MDDKVVNLIIAFFTWIGRAGCIRFIVTAATLLLLGMLLFSGNVPSSVQKTVMPILSWAWMMVFIKRGHDFGSPAWMSLIVWFTTIFVVPVFFWAFWPGDDAPNAYGDRGAWP